jgi:hypothetical protein
MRHLLIAATILTMGASPAFAAVDSNAMNTMRPSEPSSSVASNIDAADASSMIAPQLPAPDLGANATPADYLRAAESALHEHRSGLAQNTLEMAETRLLDRAVPATQANTPDPAATIMTIDSALHALANHNVASAEQATQNALHDLSVAS